MRGLLARARGAAAPAAAPACGACGTGGNPQLRAALQRVTHSDSAAVPPQTLQEAVRLAAESEESLALALRHVEENMAAPPREWRRIHGAVALLDRLMRPREGGGDEAPLVGRLWFEAKAQQRLKDLVHFEHAEDTRVGLLVRRVASSAQATAERYVLAETGEEFLGGRDTGHSPSAGRRCDLEGGADAASAPAVRIEAPPSPSQLRTANPQDGSKVVPRILGRSNDEVVAPPAKLRDAASALEALNNPVTRNPQLPERVADAVLSGDDLEPQWRRWLCCRCRARQLQRTPREGQADTDNSECETNTLLARVGARV